MCIRDRNTSLFEMIKNSNEGSKERIIPIDGIDLECSRLFVLEVSCFQSKKSLNGTSNVTPEVNIIVFLGFVINVHGESVRLSNKKTASDNENWKLLQQNPRPKTKEKSEVGVVIRRWREAKSCHVMSYHVNQLVT